MAFEIDEILNLLDSKEEEALARLFRLLAIPSISTDPACKESCKEAADYCLDLLKELGFKAQLHQTNGQPIVLAHYAPRHPRSDLHVLFYGHYDVQPPDPLTQWRMPPFEPRLADDPRNGTVIIARGASDDKGQLMTFLEAVRAILAIEGEPPFRLTVMLEGEEECGSPSLAPFLTRHKEELRADMAIVCDTNQWDKNTPAITTMLRGLANVEVTVHGPGRDLHSGFFGGAARNPAQLLCALLGQARDEKGHIVLQGFYDDIIEPDAKQLREWALLDFDAKRFLGDIGLSEAAGEHDRSLLEQLWSRPSMEINGLTAGYQGDGVKTVIPAIASAKLSFRLVPGQKPEHILASFRHFVAGRLPTDCHAEFSSEMGSPAISFNPEKPYFRIAASVLRDEFSVEPVMMGCGASIPIVGAFAHELNMDTMLIGFALEDDCVHSPNEKYNLSSYRHGCRSFARLIMGLAELRASDSQSKGLYINN